MTIISSIRLTTNRVQQAEQAFAQLSSLELYVGVPSDKNERHKDTEQSRVSISGGKVTGGVEVEINNATIAYINDNGSPAMNIPQRSFMRPGMSDCKEKIANRMKNGAIKALRGDLNASYAAFTYCGMAAQNAIRKRITDGIPPPLADRTLRERVKANRGKKGALIEINSRAAGNEPSVEFSKPLIVTGQLRNSITYVIKNKVSGTETEG